MTTPKSAAKHTALVECSDWIVYEIYPMGCLWRTGLLKTESEIYSWMEVKPYVNLKVLTEHLVCRILTATINTE